MKSIIGIKFINIPVVEYTPSQSGDNKSVTSTKTKSVLAGFIKSYTDPSASGFEYALYPNITDSSLDGTTYVGDYCNYVSSGVVLFSGGDYGQYQTVGAFCSFGNLATTSKVINRGSRLMVLPPSRLTA